MRDLIHLFCVKHLQVAQNVCSANQRDGTALLIINHVTLRRKVLYGTA